MYCMKVLHATVVTSVVIQYCQCHSYCFSITFALCFKQVQCALLLNTVNVVTFSRIVTNKN